MFSRALISMKKRKIHNLRCWFTCEAAFYLLRIFYFLLCRAMLHSTSARSVSTSDASLSRRHKRFSAYVFIIRSLYLSSFHCDELFQRTVWLMKNFNQKNMKKKTKQRFFSVQAPSGANWILARRSTSGRRKIDGGVFLFSHLFIRLEDRSGESFTAKRFNLNHLECFMPSFHIQFRCVTLRRLSSSPTVKSGCFNFLQSLNVEKPPTGIHVRFTVNQKEKKNFIVFCRSAVHLEKSKSFPYRLHVFKYWLLSCERRGKKSKMRLMLVEGNPHT